MFTKSLIATAVAAAIAVGTASTASAHGPGPIHFHGPGKDVMKDFKKDFKKDFGKKHDDDFYSGWSFPGMFFMNFGSRTVCTPVYDDEWVWNPWKGWVLETVKVGEKCKPQPYGFNFGW